MKYKIKYNYNTGDSESNEDGLESYLDMIWENLDVVKANLIRIKEHYIQHQDLNSYKITSVKSNQDILEENRTKDWFVEEIKDCVYYKNNMGQETYNCISKEQAKKYEENKEYRVGTFIDSGKADNNIILYTDGGKAWQFWAPWTGYFESLNYVEIVPDNSDMKIEF